ncbi:hypothetical protein BJQ97_03484 [Geobacillus sp. TFV-3]|nr:hypothetical protein BJQ97_03484 [Geobacillus sp. TFV-3]
MKRLEGSSHPTGLPISIISLSRRPVIEMDIKIYTDISQFEKPCNIVFSFLCDSSWIERIHCFSPAFYYI